VRSSDCHEEKWRTATVFTTQRVLWDMFLVLGIFTATCCLTLHRAGLNDLNTPISVEYAEGNRLAILFFCSSLCLIIVTGLLYRCFGQRIAALLSFLVLLFLATVVASRPHTIVHFYAFYATLFGAILTPLFVLWKLKLWPSFWGLIAVLVTVVLLIYWAGTKDWDIGGLGMAQRAWVIVAWLSNSYVLNHCRHFS
jgi:hypothetical protein